jgi:hypothetical protein
MSFQFFLSVQAECPTASTWPTAHTATSWSNDKPSTCHSRSSTRSSGSRTCWTARGRRTPSTSTPTGSRLSAAEIAVCPEMPTDVETAEKPPTHDWLIPKVNKTSNQLFFCTDTFFYRILSLYLFFFPLFLGVNFINILHAHFLYKHLFGSFSLATSK